MGYDVSFHPIREEEIKEWYWNPVIKGESAESLRAKASAVISDVRFLDAWLALISDGRHYDPEIPFDCCHGMAIAQIQGFVRPFYYIRGGVFTCLLKKEFYVNCCRTWEEILDCDFNRPVWNCMRENYCSGAYITADGVRRIYNALEANHAGVYQDMIDVFGKDNLPVFVKALKESIKLGTGLLEATEVVEPNPFDLRQTKCITNLMNCDFDGVAIYRQIAMAQLGNAIKD